MRKLAYLAVAIAVLVVAFSTQARNTDAPPVSLTISGPSQAKAGTAIEITVTMTNNSTQRIDAGSFYVGGVDMAYKYEIRDKLGNLIQNKHKEMVGSARIATLEPGKSIEQKTLLSRVADMSQPGKYVIQVSRAIPKELGGGVAKSNKITVTVTP